jgi:methyl-accepting chemotaxis protein
VKGSGTVRNLHIVRTYFWFSIGFGVLMGVVFPLYASYFVSFESGGKKIAFALGCVAAGALVGLVSFLIGRFSLLNFISDMADRMNRLSLPDADLGERIPFRSPDCVGRLAEAFNRFQDKLRELLDQLNAVAEKTKMIGLELAANSTETSASSEQISRHMDLINEQTRVLVEEVDTVDAARQMINDASKLVSDNIDRQSDSLTSLSALIEDSVMSVRSVSSDTDVKIAGIRDILSLSHQSVSDISRVSEKIRSLQDEIASVGKNLAMIDDIAERITVLGINASIEAARSGAAGKGFSVVAQEIRKLADMARGNSAAISEQLSGVVDSARVGTELSDATAAHLNSFLDKIGATVEDIRLVSERMAHLSDTSQAMLDAHMHLVKVSIDVTNSMMTLRDGSNSIERSMGVLLSTADENMRAIEEISVGMREITADVAHLDRVSAQNAESVKALNEEIGKFKSA